MDYFYIEPEEMNDIKLNRIDVHCDYRYQDFEELLIIYNIISKAPDRFYTYKKEYIKDDEEGYITAYIASKKKKYEEDLIRLEG